MTTATLSAATRDPFMPQPVQRTGPALTLALVAHALLVAALAFGVNWRNDEPTTLAAELWSAMPQAAAPRAVEPPPATPPKTAVKAAPPPPTPTPAPPTPAPPDPQIAIEKAKREEAKRQADEDAKLKAEQKAAQKAKDDAAQKKADADRVAQEKADAAKQKAEAAKEAAKEAATREANLKRIAGLAGATGGATDTGTALHSSAPSANYAGRIAAYIKPRITLIDSVDGNPRAVVEIRLATDGTITGKRLVKSSGAKAWDDAVLRAVDSAGVLPRDTDGRVPPVIEIGFRPQD